MPRNGSGQYNLPYNWNDDKANGIKVLASRMQNQDQDIADALTGSLAADGQTALTGELDFNSNRAVDLGDGQATQDAVVVGQAQTGELQYYGLSSTIPLGAPGQDYEVNANPTLTEYVDGLTFSLLAHLTCISSPVLRVDTEAELDMIKDDGNGNYTALVAGDILADHVYECAYNEAIGVDKILVKNPEIRYITTNNMVGGTMLFPANVAPTGWFELDGTLKSRAIYPKLWAFAQASGNIVANDGAWTGGEFSPGDGSTTFRIPDTRGYYIRSWSNAGTIDSGRAIGSIQLDAFQGHFHNIKNNVSGNIASNITMVFSGSASPTAVSGGGSGQNANLSVDAPITDGTNGTPRTASETRSINIAWINCIKY